MGSGSAVRPTSRPGAVRQRKGVHAGPRQRAYRGVEKVGEARVLDGSARKIRRLARIDVKSDQQLPFRPIHAEASVMPLGFIISPCRNAIALENCRFVSPSTERNAVRRLSSSLYLAGSAVPRSGSGAKHRKPHCHNACSRALRRTIVRPLRKRLSLWRWIVWALQRAWRPGGPKKKKFSGRCVIGWKRLLKQAARRPGRAHCAPTEATRCTATGKSN